MYASVRLFYFYLLFRAESRRGGTYLQSLGARKVVSGQASSSSQGHVETNETNMSTPLEILGSVIVLKKIKKKNKQLIFVARLL